MSAIAAQLEIPAALAGTPSVVTDRYEYKYKISPALLDPIRSFLGPHCIADPFSAREPAGFYNVTSLYLDSSNYKTFWDKQHAAPSRFKLRVRTYGEEIAGPVKFEIKRFLNEITRKTCVSVPREIWTRLLSGPTGNLALALGPAEKRGLNDFLWLTRAHSARPKMLVRYERQAFRGRLDDSVRISFDRRLQYQPASSYCLTGRPANWRSSESLAGLGRAEPWIVLELKFASRIPAWLVDMVRTFGLVRGGYSKYCSAVKRTLYSAQISGELASAIPSRHVVQSQCSTC